MMSSQSGAACPYPSVATVSAATVAANTMVDQSAFTRFAASFGRLSAPVNARNYPYFTSNDYSSLRAADASSRGLANGGYVIHNYLIDLGFIIRQYAFQLLFFIYKTLLFRSIFICLPKYNFIRLQFQIVR